jgi:uncharacterized protein YegP (UPF0339 family)
MSYPRYEIFKDKAGAFRFNLIAINYKIVLTSSEGYVAKGDCERGIEICQTNAPKEQYYSRRTTISNQFYFTLLAVNGKDIGRSEDYQTVFGRDQGIDVVKRDGPTKTIVDKT